MANRFWRGGTGTWNSTSTTNWSATSGGAGGASVPTAADNVIFDVNSNIGTGAFTVTMADSPRVCNNITISGLDGVMTLAGSGVGLTVSGSLTFPAALVRTYTGTTTFDATTSGNTVITNGVAFGGVVIFAGSGGGWTLGSAFSCGTNPMFIALGTFSTSASNFAVTAGSLELAGVGATTVTLNASTVTLSGTTLPWDASRGGLTLNAGTSTIILSGASGEFAGGGKTYYNVSFTSTSPSSTVPRTISGANTFSNFLTFATPAAAGIFPISIAADQAVIGTLTVAGSNGNRRMFLRSDTMGTPRTLFNDGLAAVTDVDFRDITMAGTASPVSGTRLGNCGGNANVTFTTAANKYWNLAAGGNWSATAWALSSGGAVADVNFPLPQDTVIIGNTGLNTSAVITINFDWNIGNFDASARTNNMTLASGTTNPTFYGNYASGTGITQNSGTETYTFSNRATKTLASITGTGFQQKLNFNAPGGGIQLTGASSTSCNGITFTNGTLDLNGRGLTSNNTILTATGTKNITFNGGSLVAASGVPAWDNVAPTGFTTTAGTGTGLMYVNAFDVNPTKTFNGGGSVYNCTLYIGDESASANVTINGENTFNDINSNGASGTVTFQANTTQTFVNFNLSNATLRSTTPGIQARLSKAIDFVSVSGVDIQDSAAIGGASWFALPGSVNSGNNSGWQFSSVLNGDFFLFF